MIRKDQRLTAPDIRAMKGGKPIVCLTAYTKPTAETLDGHVDLLLVGTQWQWFYMVWKPH